MSIPENGNAGIFIVLEVYCFKIGDNMAEEGFPCPNPKKCDGTLEYVGTYNVEGIDKPPQSCYRCNKCYWNKWYASK